jgi:tetratricopeptide (TPR) repeat protein
VGRLQQEGEDINFLFGSYPPGGAATASGAWSTAYREHFGAEGLTETLVEYLTVTPILIPAFAALLRGEPPPKGEEALTKDSIQTVFVHATRALAAERPTVVLIEDLHFAPEEGRAMLASLALAVPEHRILLVGTTRPGLPEDWVANLERLDHAAHLAIDRLGPKDLAYLLKDAFHSERLAHELGVQIGVKSDGNPFFIFEIIRGLREGQFIKKRPDGTWVSTQVIEEIQIPSSVQDLIQARIADLDEEEQEILDVAACCGFEFDPGLVSEAVGVGRVPALRRFGHLEKAHRIIRSAGRNFLFDHHQVQEALYEGISEQLREEYHAAIGDALAALHPEPDGASALDLCEHFLKGGRGERALPYFDAAFEHLERVYLNDRAVVLADRALEARGLLEGRERMEVQLKKDGHLDLLGRREEQQAALDEALVLADGSREPLPRARVKVRLGQLLLNVSRYGEAQETLVAAIDLAREAGDAKEEARATGNLGVVFMNLGQYAEARQRYERSLALFRDIGDRQGEARATLNLGIVFLNLGRHGEARERCERSLAIFREMGDRQGEARAMVNLGIDSLGLGQYEEVRERSERSLALFREIGDRQGEATATVSLGNIFLCLGRYEEAGKCHERQLALAREIGYRRGEAIALANLGIVLATLGHLSGALERLEASRNLCMENGDRRLEGYVLFSLGDIARQKGEREEAIRLFQDALALWREMSYASGVAESLAALGGLLIDAGRAEEARPRLEEALALGRRLEAPGTIALASCRLALLPCGDVPAALKAFSEHEPKLEHQTRMDTRFLLWRATKDRVHLEEAHRLLCHLRDHAPEEYRETMIEHVPLHRDIMAAWEEHGG